MKILVAILWAGFVSFLVIATSCNDVCRKEQLPLSISVRAVMEKAYFEGQRDALTNDIRIIRIKSNNDSIWSWSRSPWDDGDTPTFIPTK